MHMQLCMYMDVCKNLYFRWSHVSGLNLFVCYLNLFVCYMLNYAEITLKYLQYFKLKYLKRRSAYSMYVYVLSTPCLLLHMYTYIARLCTHMYVLGMKQYESMPYCILCLSVLQYIAILQYVTGL